MLHKIEDSERMIKDRKNLRAFNRQIEMTDKNNTYETIRDITFEYMAEHSEFTVNDEKILKDLIEYVKNKL